MSGSGPGPPGRFALWAFVSWLAVTVVWWALAFAPLPLPPAWLAAARAVCFGTLPNGLPDTWGWFGLIVSPLAMLGFLLAVWGRELAASLAGMARRPVGRALLALLVAVPLVGAGWVGARVRRAAAVSFDPRAETLPVTLPDDYPQGVTPAPPLGLVDQRGRLVSLEDFAGRPLVVTFAFAHCRTICPVIVRTVSAAAARLGAAAPPVVVVTLDPWRDTPGSLPGLARQWQLDSLAEAHVLSGEVPQVLEVLESWRMPIERDPRTGDVTHPALVYVVGPAGRLSYTLNNPPVEWVVEAVRRVDLRVASGMEQ